MVSAIPRRVDERSRCNRCGFRHCCETVRAVSANTPIARHGFKLQRVHYSIRQDASRNADGTARTCRLRASPGAERRAFGRASQTFGGLSCPASCRLISRRLTPCEGLTRPEVQRFQSASERAEIRGTERRRAWPSAVCGYPHTSLAIHDSRPKETRKADPLLLDDKTRRELSGARRSGETYLIKTDTRGGCRGAEPSGRAPRTMPAERHTAPPLSPAEGTKRTARFRALGGQTPPRRAPSHRVSSFQKTHARPVAVCDSGRVGLIERRRHFKASRGEWPIKESWPGSRRQRTITASSRFGANSQGM